VTGETPQALCAKRLTARPTQDEHPGAPINHPEALFTKQQSLWK